MKTPLKALLAASLLTSLASFGMTSCSNEKKSSAETASVSTDVVTQSTEPATTEPAASEPATTETAASEDTAMSESGEAGAATEAGASSSESAVARLEDDSPTCNAIRQVKELNDATGKLTEEVVQKISEGAIAEDPSVFQKAFDDYIGEFSKQSKEMVPKLTDAYDVLAKEQPQFKDDLSNLKEVTVVLVAEFGKMKGKDLATLDLGKVIGDAMPTEKVTAAGLASLKIDKFSMAACDLPFANR